VNSFEWCDLEKPFQNIFCPLPGFLFIFPNLILKIGVCVLIPPILDEFAEEYMTGQGPPLKVWNAIFLDEETKITKSHASGRSGLPDVRVTVQDQESEMEDSQILLETSLLLEDGAAPSATQHPEKPSADRQQPLSFSHALARQTMDAHLEKHLYSDFASAQKAKSLSAVPASFHALARRVHERVDTKILLPTERQPIGTIFTEEFSSLLHQAGLGTKEKQRPRAAGPAGGGGHALEGGHRGKILPPLIKKGIFAATVNPFIANVVKQLTYSVAGQVAPPVFDAVTDVLRDELPDSIMHVVMHVTGNAVGMSVGTTVPESVERLLPIVPIKMLTQSVTQMLTRSVGHALSRTLIHSVGSKPIRDYYCYFCMNYGYACTQCHEHNTSSMRYAAHYASYFAPYFGDYYSDHYAGQIYEIMKKDKSS
jgi:hypothetical protein